MRPEAGARYADRVRGGALHHLRKHCIGRTRSPYARTWRVDGRLAVLLPACRIRGTHFLVHRQCAHSSPVHSE
eukprot:2353970-Prymnesium_polylepis.1